MSACRSCGAEVIWLTIRPGSRRMPIDPDPAEDGNVLADLEQAVGTVIPAVPLAEMKAATPAEPFYRSHFATCPHAEQWRRPRVVP